MTLEDDCWEPDDDERSEINITAVRVVESYQRQSRIERVSVPILNRQGTD